MSSGHGRGGAREGEKQETGVEMNDEAIVQELVGIADLTEDIIP